MASTTTLLTIEDFECLPDEERGLRPIPASGTSEVWMIAPASQSVHIFSDRRNVILAGNDELSTPLIPGFSITVEDLFNQA